MTQAPPPRRLARAVLALALGAVTVTVTAPAVRSDAAVSCVANSSATSVRPSPTSRAGHAGPGFARPQRRELCGTAARARVAAAAEQPYDPASSPPLVNAGDGPVMGTNAPGQVVITPVFWAPTGYTFPTGYQALIEKYLTDVAADSGAASNVFSTLTQYGGSNGTVHYAVSAGTTITDTHAYPAPGTTCTPDAGAIYADLSGYTACIDDAKMQTELQAVRSANSLPADLAHLYVLLLPPGVESCFDQNTSANQACSINPTSTSAYCGYHDVNSQSAVYAVLPFPVYASPLPQTCSSEFDSPGTSSPNGNLAGDVEISILSHEVAEAITDPHLNAWLDATQQFENGDECAYIYGPLSGAVGQQWNQKINGDHYLTQEEFSNKLYSPGAAGCAQDEAAPTAAAMTPAAGPAATGRTVTITGTNFRLGHTGVSFGSILVAPSTLSATSLTVTTPAHSPGSVGVRVKTPDGTSSPLTYTFAAAPRVTAVSPALGPTVGGTTVTLSGSGFTAVTAVGFGGAAASHVVVVSPTRLTARAPRHAAGVVDVHVTAVGGTSPATAGDRYRYLARPVVTGITPRSGPRAGGTLVTVTGRALDHLLAVHLGTATATGLRVLSPGRITLRTPAHGAGVVDMRIRTAGGLSAAVRADRFTYLR